LEGEEELRRLADVLELQRRERPLGPARDAGRVAAEDEGALPLVVEEPVPGDELRRGADPDGTAGVEGHDPRGALLRAPREDALEPVAGELRGPRSDPDAGGAPLGEDPRPAHAALGPEAARGA